MGLRTRLRALNAGESVLMPGGGPIWRGPWLGIVGSG